jgi:hypothetical protein
MQWPDRCLGIWVELAVVQFTGCLPRTGSQRSLLTSAKACAVTNLIDRTPSWEAVTVSSFCEPEGPLSWTQLPTVRPYAWARQIQPIPSHVFLNFNFNIMLTSTHRSPKLSFAFRFSDCTYETGIYCVVLTDMFESTAGIPNRRAAKFRNQTVLLIVKSNICRKKMKAWCTAFECCAFTFTHTQFINLCFMATNNKWICRENNCLQLSVLRSWKVWESLDFCVLLNSRDEWSVYQFRVWEVPGSEYQPR